MDEGLGRQRQAAGPAGRRHAPRRGGLRRDLRQGRRRAQQAGAARHDLPHLLHDQAAHLDGDQDALRRRPLPARRPDLEVHSRLRQPARVPGRQPRQDGPRAGRARHHLPRPAHPHVGPDLRHDGDQRRRRALSRQGRRRRFPDLHRHAQGRRRAARHAATDRPARQGVELQRVDRRAGIPRRGDLGHAVREVPRREGDQAARHDRHRFLPAAPTASSR